VHVADLLLLRWRRLLLLVQVERLRHRRHHGAKRSKDPRTMVGASSSLCRVQLTQQRQQSLHAFLDDTRLEREAASEGQEGLAGRVDGWVCTGVWGGVEGRREVYI
jgi:hypothetical protein